MPWISSHFITEADLGIAYRKAKADLYYERTVPYMREIYKYERNLAANLRSLYEKLQSGNLDWMQHPSFFGTWSLIPKGIDPKEAPDDPGCHCLRSDPAELWQSIVENYRDKGKKPKAEFRQVGRHSIDFHIISALWILKVGHVYDSILGEEAYGSRLRRKHDDESLGEINPYSIGTFKHYLHYYRSWRENGLKAMSRGIEDGKRVIAITSDLRQFYHQLSPRFLSDPEYLTSFGLDYRFDQDHFTFTAGMIDAIEAWAKTTPLHKNAPHVGLPVSLSASRLIANVSLVELDRIIKQELQPLYYGRYVDDIILVLEDTHNLKSAREIWDFIEKKTDGVLSVLNGDSPGGLAVKFSREYLGDSDLRFMGSKQKTFLLKGASGKALVDSIRNQINKQASEWRRLPELEEQPDMVVTALLEACGDDGKAVDSLRKADDLSLSRAGFAICLRDFEAFEQDLTSENWALQRKTFFDAVCRHFLSLPKLFDYAPYIPRLAGLAMACRDYEAVKNLLVCLKESLKKIESDCLTSIAGLDKEEPAAVNRWREHLVISLYEALVAAISPSHKADSDQIEEVLNELPLTSERVMRSARTLFTRAQYWFSLDLARRPLRMRFMPYIQEQECWEEIPSAQNYNEMRDDTLFTSLPWNGAESFYRLLPKGKDAGPMPLAMLFPTRPFNVGELFMLAPEKIGDSETIQEWTMAFRGFQSTGELPQWSGGKRNRKNGDVLFVSSPDNHDKVRFALGSLLTMDESWEASVMANKDPDAKRYRRINDLVNGVIETPTKPHYLLLPELSVPPKWFPRIAMKLAHQGISLIAGVEYLHHGLRKKKVANQTWASLLTDFVGFMLPIFYRQDKADPALHEEDDLWKKAGVKMSPLGKPLKPIISHGGFYFTILVCSELTNIEYRTVVRGNVDALLVPAWNKDIDTFSSLIESSALDIHAYIVQSNNRKYGDSRIRVPHRDSWMRDEIRVKGGIDDYAVIGEINIDALRKFQSYHRSPDGPFKPIPDGFVIHPLRKK